VINWFLSLFSTKSPAYLDKAFVKYQRLSVQSEESLYRTESVPFKFHPARRSR